MPLIVLLSDLKEMVIGWFRAAFGKRDARPGIRELVCEPSLSPIAWRCLAILSPDAKCEAPRSSTCSVEEHFPLHGETFRVRTSSQNKHRLTNPFAD